MRTILIRVIVFSMGVFAFWVTHFLRVYGVHAAHGGMAYDAIVATAVRYAGSLTISSGVGVLLGLAIARGATTLVPVWLTAPAGVLFGFLTDPVMDALRTAGLPIPKTLFGSLLAVAIAAAVFAWLCAQTTQSLRRRFPKIRNEYHRINANRMEKIGLLLAVSPWFFGTAQLLGIPGFG